MWRAVLVGVLSLGVGSSSEAMDWRSAGGGLFAGRPEPVTLPAPAQAVDEARVPEPVQPYAEAIRVVAERHGLDAKLLHALVIVESAYRSRIVSPAGAGGLTQLMPGTAALMKVTDRFDPMQALDGGAAYLARQVVRFGDIRLALAAYNVGPARVAALGRVPPIPETQSYVVAVVDCYLALTAGRSARNARSCVAPRF